MAAKSPQDTHNQWPNVASTTELPNVSGASIQDAAVEAGDQCYVIGTGTYQCDTATVGAAVWSSMGGGAPAAHASTHESGGGDALTVDAAAGTGSLRTLGTASTAACAGDDSRLSDARTPTSHASTHDAGGGDAMAIDAVAGTGSLRTLGTASTAACAGNDSRLSDSRTPTTHATSHESAGGDVIAHQNLSGAGTNDHSTIDSHISNTSNPHTVTAAQVGNTTAQWNANQLQGVDVDTIAPTDGQVLVYNSTDTEWQAGSPAAGTSYLEMGGNHTITSAGGSPDLEDVGVGIFDASEHSSVTLRATLKSIFATTGTTSIKLYDDGSLSTPATPRLVSTFSQTVDTTDYEVFEQALTIVSSSASTNQILSEGRVYRIVIEVTASSGDTGYVGTAGFFAEGNADVVNVAADDIQAIAMSLNA